MKDPGGVLRGSPGGGGIPIPHTAIRVPGHRPASRLGYHWQRARGLSIWRGGWGFSVYTLHIE